MSDSFVSPETLKPIILETEYDLSLATVTKILYHKPDGTKGSWTATISGNDLVYLPQTGDIDQSGVWKFQSYIEVGGEPGMGAVTSKEFKTSLL